MYIESTFMRKGHGPGDIIGVTLNNNALKRWSLSLHKCSCIISYRVEMTDANAEPYDVTVHQEEMPGRIAADAKDRQTIVDILAICIVSMNPVGNPSSLLNNVAGMLATVG